MRTEQASQTRVVPGAAGTGETPTLLPLGAEPGKVGDDRTATPVHLRSLLRAAVLDLGALFADEHARANGLLEQQGRDERIVVTRHGIERRYSFGDSVDRRCVSLFACVPAVDGHAFGGAFVTTSKTPPYIYLLPTVEGARVRWIVTATRTSFNRMTARDLFSAVFGDDDEALTRINPLIGFDLFQTPWS